MGKDPPIYLCEKGHGLCQTCRDPLKAQDQPCPVCRGKLIDARSLGLENILEQLPKIKCKNEGCTLRSDQLVNDKLLEMMNDLLLKSHEDECRERPVKCELCQEPIAMSKLWDHLVTKHESPPLSYENLGDGIVDWNCSSEWNGYYPLSKVNNELELMVNW